MCVWHDLRKKNLAFSIFIPLHYPYCRQTDAQSEALTMAGFGAYLTISIFPRAMLLRRDVVDDVKSQF